MNQSVKDQKINNLIALYSQGEIERAIAEAKKLVKVYKKEPFLFNFLGVSSMGIGSIDESIRYYKEALSLNSQYYEVYNNIGLAYNDLKKPNIAIKYLNKAIQIYPDYAEAYNNIGNTQKDLGNTTEAILSYKKAININPNYVDAYTNLGIVHSVLEEFDEAEKAFKKALSLDLSNKNIAYYLADNYFNREFLDQAIEILDNYFKEEQTPDSLNLRGKVLQKKGSVKALGYYYKALENSNRKDEVLSNIGSFYYAKREIKDAMKFYEEALQINPMNDEARINLAYAHLSKSNFKSGWSGHEYRWKTIPLNKIKWPFAREGMWNNEEGKRVSLWKEQGIGDEVVFLGLVPEAKERSQSLAVYIDPRLVPLCERSMPGIKFFGDTKEFEEQAFDYHMPMGSLPRLFRSDIKDFDRTIHGYLKADKVRVDTLRREMGLEDKRVIGISWKSIRSLTTSKKSMMLKDFGTIFKGMDIVLLNLQYGEVQEEIDEFTETTGIEVLQCKSVDNREDLDGLAALIELCDLVVSTSNITIHLAGALGKETWVLVSSEGGIWWLLDRTDSIWYPTLRLYRQKTLDDWGSVLSIIHKDLEKKFGEPR